MSRIRADKFVNNAANGAPQLTFGAEVVAGVGLTGAGGINITGIATAASFSGNLTGNVTGNADTATTATNAQGLTGTPNITVGNVVGVAATFTGVLTYEDVANVDSVGLVTARTGIKVLAGGADVVGILTVSEGTDLKGFKVEEGHIDNSTQLNGEIDFKLENGNVQRFIAATAGNYFPDFKVSATKSLSSVMAVGSVVTCTMIVASSSHFLTAGSIKIDDSASNLDIDNVGGSAPSAANGSGFDIYSFTITKTASTPAYHIVVNTVGAN